MGRVDATEYAKRIYTIQGWIIEGVQASLICRQILTNNWCTSQRHAERMLKAARDEWTKIPEAELDQRRKLKLVELQQLKRGLKDGYKGTPAGIMAQLAVEKQIIKLEGLTPAQEHVIKGDPDAPLKFENKNAIDVAKLPTDVLKAIVNARKPRNNT